MDKYYTNRSGNVYDDERTLPRQFVELTRRSSGTCGRGARDITTYPAKRTMDDIAGRGTGMEKAIIAVNAAVDA